MSNYEGGQEEVAPSISFVAKYDMGCDCCESGFLRKAPPVLPTRIFPESTHVIYPHIINAIIWSNSDAGVASRERAYAKRPCLGADAPLPSVPKAGGVVVIPNRCISTHRIGTGWIYRRPLRPQPIGKISCVEGEAFWVANTFSDASIKFRFCASSAYGAADIMDFIIIRSMRNRARPDNTLSWVGKLMRDFIVFVTSPDAPSLSRGGVINSID